MNNLVSLLTQIAAAVGPIILAVMRVIVSIKPPKAYRPWVASFIVVGIITAIASIAEMRGNDTTMNNIWSKISVPNGPRLEFAGIKEISDNKVSVK
jgi:hypothetical protein